MNSPCVISKTCERGMKRNSSTVAWMKLYLTEMMVLSLRRTTRSFSRSQWSTLERDAEKYKTVSVLISHKWEIQYYNHHLSGNCTDSTNSKEKLSLAAK